MTPNDNDDLWRNRFIAVNLVRIGGTIVVLIGLAIWQTNVVRPGGIPALGLPLALIGLVASFWGPVALSRHWKRRDGR
jgi:protein-S-isoprenylcysteine O-methyltransferase Ste14